jgi:hypothetical protein
MAYGTSGEEGVVVRWIDSGGVKGAVDGSVVKADENTGGETSSVSCAYGPIAKMDGGPIDDGEFGESGGNGGAPVLGDWATDEGSDS